MLIYSWNIEKNKQLKKERGVSFEEVVCRLEEGDGLDVVTHPNQTKYKGQKMLIVRISDYVYLVPFVENKGERFLKTIIPSRKATKMFIKDGEENDKAN